MSTVTISTKYQVVIPKDIREKLRLSPGQKIRAIAFEGRIELIPVRPIREMRGFLKGIDTRVDREDRVKPSALPACGCRKASREQAV